MEPRVPDVEMFIAFKWVLVLMITSALATLASLIVKRWWYGTEQHNRRAEDNEDTRGVLERFFEQREQLNLSLLELKNELLQITQVLRDNGSLLKKCLDEWQCKFEEHGRR